MGAAEGVPADDQAGRDEGVLEALGNRHGQQGIPLAVALKDLETAVYRVAQEALNNARRHACTDRVGVMLLERPASAGQGAELTLEVRDWVEKGFVPEEKAGDTAHLGIQGMIERVRLMDGSFDLRSVPGEGTTLRAVFPALKPQEEETQGDRK